MTFLHFVCPTPAKSVLWDPFQYSLWYSQTSGSLPHILISASWTHNNFATSTFGLAFAVNVTLPLSYPTSTMRLRNALYSTDNITSSKPIAHWRNNELSTNDFQRNFFIGKKIHLKCWGKMDLWANRWSSYFFVKKVKIHLSRGRIFV